MVSKIVILAVCLLKISSITSVDTDGFNMQATKAQMMTMRRSSPVNGKHYILCTFHKCNWFRAAHICKYNGMELATIGSSSEQDIIRRLFDGPQYDGPAWISGNDLGSRNDWYWLANGSPIDYFNWNVGEPNNYLNRTERCISLTAKATQHRWNNVPCDGYHLYDFICEGIYLTIGTRN